MDELLRDILIHNKILLTVLAIMFTPFGVYAAIRAIWPRRGQTAATSPEALKRIAALENTVADMNCEVSRLREENDYLTSRLAGQARRIDELRLRPSTPVP